MIILFKDHFMIEGDFAIFEDQVVVIKNIIKDKHATIQYIAGDKLRIVDLFDLEPFTKEKANKLMSEYIARIHVISECLKESMIKDCLNYI